MCKLQGFASVQSLGKEEKKKKRNFLVRSKDIQLLFIARRPRTREAGDVTVRQRRCLSNKHLEFCSFRHVRCTLTPCFTRSPNTSVGFFWGVYFCRRNLSNFPITRTELLKTRERERKKVCQSLAGSPRRADHTVKASFLLWATQQSS